MHEDLRIKQSLRDMKGFIKDIETLTLNICLDDFSADYKLQLAIERLFENLGEAANRIPKEYMENYKNIPWSKIIGLRNILAHRYDSIEYAELFEIIIKELPKLKVELDKINFD